jgi:hypothetical protein
MSNFKYFQVQMKLIYNLFRCYAVVIVIDIVYNIIINNI